MTIDTRLFYNPTEEKRYNFPMLERYGYTVDSPEIHPLTYAQPYYNQLTQYVVDTGVVEGPDESGAYAVVYKIEDLPLETALQNVKQSLKEQATSTRWNVETGGITLPDGVKINTTIDDQNRISSALQGMYDAKIDFVDFKAESGWVKLTRDELAGIAAMIANHVQACFSRERVLHETIDKATTMEELNAIDVNSGWPGQVDNEGSTTL